MWPVAVLWKSKAIIWRLFLTGMAVCMCVCVYVGVGAKQQRLNTNEKKKRKKGEKNRKKKQVVVVVAGWCVPYNNLNLFHGIKKKKKKSKPNARILPWPSHRLQQWACVWKLLYNSFSMMRFSSIAGFPYSPPTLSLHLLLCVPALAGFSFNLSPPCPSHTGFLVTL